MALVNKPFDLYKGQKPTAAQWNSLFDVLYTLVNGNINSANVDSTSIATLAGAQTISGVKTFSANALLQDDVTLLFGTGSDYWFTYDQANALFAFKTTDSDGLGADATIWSVADGGKTTLFSGPVTVGVDDTGYDVKFFGATSGKSWLWDESADTMIVTGNAQVTGTSIVNTMTLATGSITDSTGSISFGNENLSTTGTLAAGATTITGALTSNTDDGGALGASGTGWSDLFLASGAVINFNAGDVLLTHSSNALTLTGGNFGIGTTAAHPLHVEANPGAAGTPVAWLHNSGNVTGYDGVVISTVNDGDDAEVLHVRTNTTTYSGGTSLMLVRGDGKTGFGTTSPAAIIDVSSASEGLKAQLTAATSTHAAWLATYQTTTVRTYLGHQNSTGGGIVTSGLNNASVLRNDAGVHIAAGSAATTGLTVTNSGALGIGIISPDGTLHVHTATAGAVTANTNYDDIVVEGSGNSGISILSGSASQGALMFGSVTTNNAANIRFNHSTTNLIVGVGGTDFLSLDGNGNLVVGGQVADAATDGFLYIATTTAGAPSGTPTAKTGSVPMLYDDTNNKLYIYNGAWKSVTLA